MGTDKNSWKSYNEAQKNLPPRPRLVRVLETYFGVKSGDSLDLGCGSGRDTLELLIRNWNVLAVDSNPESLAMTAELAKDYGAANFRLLETSFEQVKLPEDSFDLVNASFSLPFCDPKFFHHFLNQVKASVRLGGIFTFELFGKNDSWAQKNDSKMTFLSHEEISSFFSEPAWETLFSEEKEYDGPSFSEASKHWHLYFCAFRKQGSN